jgi:hypothetical protein
VLNQPGSHETPCRRLVLISCCLAAGALGVAIGDQGSRHAFAYPNGERVPTAPFAHFGSEETGGLATPSSTGISRMKMSTWQRGGWRAAAFFGNRRGKAGSSRAWLFGSFFYFCRARSGIAWHSGMLAIGIFFLCTYYSRTVGQHNRLAHTTIQSNLNISSCTFRPETFPADLRRTTWPPDPDVKKLV